MAGVSSSQSTGHSESQSNTYIPEYSESPILREIALHARQMSDVVYQWGMDTYNKNQGNIDNLMRDALSYASPQRIAVDMGMAEAGVMQAGERGRLSAIRDLESYGIDPSSGRYAQLDSANRVMTAAAAAGAGNQQRMASQAAGNAMRNQAIAAGLQNAQFGSQANRDAQGYLNTAMSLKYPPLGRTSTSTSDQQSTSGSVSDSGGGGSSSKGGEKEPKQQQQGGGGGQPRQAAQPRAEKEGGGGPTMRAPPQRPGGELPPIDIKSPDEEIPLPRPDPRDEEYPGSDVFDSEQELPQEYPGSDVFDTEQELPGEEPWMDPNEGTPVSEDELTAPDETGFQPPSDEMANYPGSEVFDSEQELPAYDPYAGQTLVDNSAFNPVTGDSEGGGLDQQVAEADPAGSLYGLGEGGGWSSDVIPASYTAPEFGGDETWSDIGQGAAGQTFDSTYDTAEYTDEPWTDEATYEDEYGGDWGGDIGDDEYGDLGDFEDTSYDDTGYDDWDTGYDDWDTSYDDEYSDWGEEDYYDDQDWGDEEGYDDEYQDYSDEDFYDDQDWSDEEDYSDFEDDTTDYSDYEDEVDYSDAGDYEGGYEGGDDYEYQDDGADAYEYADSGDGGDYARGGPVRRKRRRNMQRPGGPPRQRPMTGYGQRPMRRPPPGGVPAFRGGGRVPPPGAGFLTPPPPRPGGRMQKPQQAPRPQRGAPMAQPGGPRPTQMIGRGPQMPGNFISANGMPPPTTGGMQRPQRMARGGQAGRQPEPTQGGFVSRSLSPSGGSTTDDVQARLNAGEFVIPKDVATWKGKEFFYKMIANARKMRSGGGNEQKPQTGYGGGGMQ